MLKIGAIGFRECFGLAGLDYGLIIRNAFTLWNRDEKSLKYMAAYLVSSLFFTVLLLGIGYLLFKDVIFQFLELSKSSSLAAGGFSGGLQQLFASALSSLIIFTLALIPLVIAWLLLASYLQSVMQLRALELLGFTTASFGFGKLLKLILLSIWFFIAVLTSWYERRFMYAFIGLIAFTLIGAVLLVAAPLLGALFLLLSMLGWLLYFFITVYNSVRLSMAYNVFLRNDIPIAEATSESWKLTNGKTFDIFISMLIVSVIIFVADFVLGIILYLFRLAVVLATNNELLGFLLGQLLQIIFTPLWLAIGVFANAAIYSQLAKPSAEAAQRVSRFAAK